MSDIVLIVVTIGPLDNFSIAFSIALSNILFNLGFILQYICKADT